jgi:hypothetical protein
MIVKIIENGISHTYRLGEKKLLSILNGKKYIRRDYEKIIYIYIYERGQ